MADFGFGAWTSVTKYSHVRTKSNASRRPWRPYKRCMCPRNVNAIRTWISGWTSSCFSYLATGMRSNSERGNEPDFQTQKWCMSEAVQPQPQIDRFRASRVSHFSNSHVSQADAAIVHQNTQPLSLFNARARRKQIKHARSRSIPHPDVIPHPS